MGWLESGQTVYVAGHQGMVGSALWRALQSIGGLRLVGWTSSELDLRSGPVLDALRAVSPDVVIVAAAKVGGIGANAAQPVEFLNDNLLIQTNIFQAAHVLGVPRLLFLGSSCIYPRLAPQPIHESALLTGPLESTNEGYALAKIAGVKAVQFYRREYGHSWISAMPTNLYGPGDNFDPETSHVLPALIRKFDDAVRSNRRVVELWGSGTPRREFLHVDDLADACLSLLRKYDGEAPVNIGTGIEVTISELAGLVASAVGFVGDIEWDPSRPDGTPRKLLDSTSLAGLGWRTSRSLDQGIQETVNWYRQHRDMSRVE